MYCSITEVERVLAQALVQALPNDSSLQNLLNIGATRSLNNVSDELVNQYIMYAQSMIDGVLSQQYAVPFRECFINSWPVSSAVLGSDVVVFANAPLLEAGQTVILRNETTGVSETMTVESLSGASVTFTANITESDLELDNTVAMQPGYPPPIPQIAARIAASFLYDRLFSAQSDPNVSNYGKEMRAIAQGELNDILNGRSILKNQHRVGDRFGNAFLDSGYGVRLPDGLSSSERNMSRLQ